MEHKPARLPLLGSPNWKDPERRQSIVLGTRAKMEWQIKSPLRIMTCWVAMAPAKLCLMNVVKQIEALVEKRKYDIWDGEKTSPGCAWDRSMHGRSVNDAQPTVIFSSSSKICRKNAKRIIQEEHIQVDPRGIGIEYYESGPKFLAGPLNLQNHHISSVISFSHSENGSQASDQSFPASSLTQEMESIIRTPDLVISGTAAVVGGWTCTIGGILLISNRAVALTVAHVFEEQVEANGETTSRFPVPEINDKIAGRIASLHQKRTLKLDQQLKNPDFDWALCLLDRERLEEKHLQLSNAVPLPDGSILCPRNYSKQDPTDSVVWVNSGYSGAVKGFVMGDYSLVALPGRRSFQRMWLVVLERFVEVGDCGSWVLDSMSGDWVGHIVAGKIGTAVAYIVLARDIIQDISDQLGVQDIQMPHETESGAQIVNDIKSTLPVPAETDFRGSHTRLDAVCWCNSASGSPGLTHDNDVEGDLDHYFGCLKFSEREEFLHHLPKDDHLKTRILKEQTRIARLRRIFNDEGSKTANGKLFETFRQTLSQRFPGRRSYSHLPPPEERGGNKSTSKTEDIEDHVILSDLNSDVVYFKRMGDDLYLQPYDHPELDDTFPNQKVPLSLLLSQSDANPLTWKCEKDMIRYFHIPANNMPWIEEAIARYYNEETPDLHTPFQRPRKGVPESKARMLLRPQFWRGLQYGARSDLPAQTRHMRPRCYPISTNADKMEPIPQNMVLFMPYLHWETDRNRRKASKAIRKTSSKKSNNAVDLAKYSKSPFTEPSINLPTLDGLPERITPRRPPGKGSLGKFLLLAASLYEAMDGYTDEKMVEKYLSTRPALHPRRTLDQSYYWTLKETASRDRDQVVYRATSPVAKHLPQACSVNITKDLLYDKSTENIKKVPRLVMVDQLWMWILDENTIITSFPQRWGRRELDPSAIQNCIRTRLKSACIDEVRSVFDLAMIIIGQCTRVFFEREQLIESPQPEMIQAFSCAIRKVKHSQKIAFDHFAEYTRLASKSYNSRNKTEVDSVQDLQAKILDIKPEVHLLCEIKDILDELFIMTLIKTQQETVARTFAKNLQPLLTRDSHGTCKRGQSNIIPFSETDRSRADKSVLEWKNVLPELADAGYTITASRELLDSLQDQLLELKLLSDAAENTSTALNDLLALKQKQANIEEAQAALLQAKESQRQSRSVMLFTVITIIFLPLSFFTGVFGMNATELTGSTGLNLYRFGDILKYMLPISFIIISCSLILLFSQVIRAILSFIFNVSWTWLITRPRTKSYVWLSETLLVSNKIRGQEGRVVNELQKQARRAELQRREAGRLREEDRRAQGRDVSTLQQRHVHTNDDIEMGRLSYMNAGQA